jgi:hypothetical protein
MTQLIVFRGLQGIGAGALHEVFLVGLCIAAPAFLGVLLLPEAPLRSSSQ